METSGQELSLGLHAHGARCSPQMLPFAPSASTAAGQLSLLVQPVIPSLFLVQFCLKVAYGLLLRKAYVYVKSEAVALLGGVGSVPTMIL